MIEKNTKIKKPIPKVKPEWYTTGRITDKTPEVIAKLIEIFRIDWTISEACWYANIDASTYHRWCNEDIAFKEKMSDAKEYWFIQARKTINTALNNWDWKLAIDVMRRRDKRYRDKLEQEQTMNLTVKFEDMSDEELEKHING